MAKNDFSTMTAEELTKRLQEAQKELQTCIFQVRSNQLKDVRSIRHKRQDIARLKTFLTHPTR